MKTRFLQWIQSATRISCVALLSLIGCSEEETFVNQYCNRAYQCTELVEDADGLSIPIDLVGISQDSIDVCAVEQNGYIDALYAMESRTCHIIAAAYEAYLQCIASSQTDIDPCAAWSDPEHACVTSFDTYVQLAGGNTDQSYAQFCPRLGRDTLDEQNPGSGFSDFVQSTDSGEDQGDEGDPDA